MLDAICRLLVSFVLLVLAGFLYWCGFHSIDTDFKLGASNIATAIIVANIGYWLRPATTKKK
jgi:hypothetical protein